MAPPTDTGVVDVAHLVPGAALTLTASGGTRLVVQNNNEGLAKRPVYHFGVVHCCHQVSLPH
jgi:hypothetical protein